MRRYYRAVRGISRLANRRLERFEAKGSSLFSQFRDKTSRLSNSDFSVVRGEVFLLALRPLKTIPASWCACLSLLARHGLPLAAGAKSAWSERGRVRALGTEAMGSLSHFAGSEPAPCGQRAASFA